MAVVAFPSQRRCVAVVGWKTFVVKAAFPSYREFVAVVAIPSYRKCDVVVILSNSFKLVATAPLFISRRYDVVVACPPVRVTFEVAAV